MIQQLMGKNILVTGATGSLGLQVCRIFSEKGLKVIGTGRNASHQATFDSLGVKLILGDLSDRQFTFSLFKDIDYVIHCAALTSTYGPWETFNQTNVVATRNIVDACKEFKVKRLVHISTPSIYFNGLPRLNVRESDPLPEPTTHYAKSKLMAEKIVDELTGSEVEVITLRPRAIFGVTDKVILPRILRLMRKGRFPLFNQGKAVVDLTYVENAVDAIELALIAPKEALYRKYNITDAQSRSVYEVFEELRLGLNLNFKYINVPVRPLLFLARCITAVYLLLGIKKEPALTEYSVGLMSFDHTLSIDEARKYLNYHPRISTAEGLKKTMEAWNK